MRRSREARGPSSGSIRRSASAKRTPKPSRAGRRLKQKPLARAGSPGDLDAGAAGQLPRFLGGGQPFQLAGQAVRQLGACKERVKRLRRGKAAADSRKRLRQAVPAAEPVDQPPVRLERRAVIGRRRSPRPQQFPQRAGGLLQPVRGEGIPLAAEELRGAFHRDRADVGVLPQVDRRLGVDMDGHAEAEGQKRRVRPLQQLVDAAEAGFGDFPQGVPLRLPDGAGRAAPRPAGRRSGSNSAITRRAYNSQ